MVAWIDKLERIASKKERLVLGLMSGTSVDSIDVAICKIKGGGLASGRGSGATVVLKHFYSHPYDKKVRALVLQAARVGVREFSELHVQIGELFAKTALTALKRAKIPSSKIDLVGSHGQTIYHHSSVKGALRATMQLGDGDVIAERLGLPVISDFRARDIATGGEGAPLTPYADAVLFASSSKRRAVLNLGGISNIAVLDRDPNRIIGFDIGPANAPLDRLVRILSKGQKNYDEGGRFARLGKVDRRFVAKLLAEDRYLKRKPPKSTGFEMYGDSFVTKLIKQKKRVDCDLIATVTEFVAASVAQAINDFIKEGIDELVVAGGGGRNPFLLSRIQAHVKPIKVILSDALGVPLYARETMAFALFANDTLLGHPVSLPSVTGARRRAVLGKISL